MALFTLSVSYGVFVGLSLLFPEVAPVLLQACGIAPAALLNYILHFYWTFREKEEGSRCPGVQPAVSHAVEAAVNGHAPRSAQSLDGLPAEPCGTGSAWWRGRRLVTGWRRG